MQAGDTLTVRLPDGRVEAEIREVIRKTCWVKKVFIVLRVNHNREI